MKNLLLTLAIVILSQISLFSQNSDLIWVKNSNMIHTGYGLMNISEDGKYCGIIKNSSDYQFIKVYNMENDSLLYSKTNKYYTANHQYSKPDNLVDFLLINTVDMEILDHCVTPIDSNQCIIRRSLADTNFSDTLVIGKQNDKFNIKFSEDYHYCYVGNNDSINVYDMKTHEIIKLIRTDLFYGHICDYDISKDMKYSAQIYEDKFVFRDYKTQEDIIRIDSSSNPRSIVLINDNNSKLIWYQISATNGNKLHVIDINTKEEIYSLEEGYNIAKKIFISGDSMIIVIYAYYGIDYINYKTKKVTHSDRFIYNQTTSMWFVNQLGMDYFIITKVNIADPNYERLFLYDFMNDKIVKEYNNSYSTLSLTNDNIIVNNLNNLELYRPSDCSFIRRSNIPAIRYLGFVKNPFQFVIRGSVSDFFDNKSDTLFFLDFITDEVKDSIIIPKFSSLLTISADKKECVYLDSSNMINLINLQTKEILNSIKYLKNDSIPLSDYTFSPNFKYLSNFNLNVFTGKRNLVVINWNTKDTIITIKDTLNLEKNFIFSKDENLVAGIITPNNIVVYSTKTKSLVNSFRVYSDSTTGPSYISFSNDGNYLVIGYYTGRIIIINAQTGYIIKTYSNLNFNYLKMSFTYDNQFLFVAGLSNIGPSMALYKVDLPTSVIEADQQVQNDCLTVFPNPATQKATIKFEIDQPCTVSLKLTDVLGNQISLIENQFMDSGSHSFEWDASGYPAGVYYYVLQAGNILKTGKVAVVR